MNIDMQFYICLKRSWQKIQDLMVYLCFEICASLFLQNHFFLFFLQAWADAFRSSPDLTGVVQIYEELKRKGIEFPMSDLETLSPIHTPQRVGVWKCAEVFKESEQPSDI